MSLPQELPQGGVVVLVGNPSHGSRTSAVSRAVAAGLAAEVDSAVEVVELADHGAEGVAAGDDRVRRARETVTGASLLVVATPVYKAGYTGLLKLFLDTFEPTALESTVTVPVILTASGAHGALGARGRDRGDGTDRAGGPADPGHWVRHGRDVHGRVALRR